MKQAATQPNKVWNVAMYIRISNHDKNEESESVANQRALITQYILELHDGDTYRIFGEYVDDGISGTTDVHRTEFQRLLADIQKGLINCVVVKDLARSFRNYSDQGYYLDEWFPQHQVRFISLYHQPLDTYKDTCYLRNIMVPIQGILNENYSAEMSAKVRMAKEAQRKRGDYTGNWGAYGYIRNPADKHKLMIDTEAAAVVKAIYQMFLEGMTRSAITRYLNEQQILCPSVYRKEKLQMPYRSYFAERSSLPLWSVTTVTAILQNRTYCGDLVQGRVRTKSYKLRKTEPVPEEDWVIVPNTHEAIIDRAVFEKAQVLLQKSFRPKPKQKYPQLYAGLLYCGDCGKSMAKQGAGKRSYQYYVCNTYRTQSKQLCTAHSIRSDKLDAAVLRTIQQQLCLGCAYDSMVQQLEKMQAVKEPTEKITMAIQEKEQQLQQNKADKRKAYLDWKRGAISRETYHKLKAGYEAVIERLQREMIACNRKMTDSKKEKTVEKNSLQTHKAYKTLPVLTRDILIQLVKRIDVYEGNNIKITFLTKNEWQKMQEN